MSRDINEMLKSFIDKFSIENEDLAFELLSCVAIFEVSPYYAIDNCWNVNKTKDGSYKTDNNDGKIDGYYIQSDKDKIVVNLLQCKNTSKLKIDKIQGFYSSAKNYLIDKLDNELPANYKSLETIREKIKEEKNKYPMAVLKYQLIISSNANNNTIQTLQKMFDDNFQDNQAVKSRFVNFKNIEDSLKKIRGKILNYELKDSDVRLETKTTIDLIKYTKSEVVVTVLSGNQIVKLINNEFKHNFELSRLFSGNVRGFLNSTDVNNDMKKTIEEHPLQFLSKNNGAVIVCDCLKIDSDRKSLVIKNPIIVNGQQTISTIYKQSVNQKNLKKIDVMVKFIAISAEDKEEILLDIAKASNQANEVNPLDLLSNRRLFKQLVKRFGEKNVYLKVKEGVLLNEIFLNNEESISFINLLQIWVSIYLKRPADAKTVRKNINIFTKAYDKPNSKLNLLTKQENEEKLLSMFLIANEVYQFTRNQIKTYFSEKIYYEHAQYFILYLLSEMQDDICKSSPKDFERVDNIINDLIMQARTKKEAEDKEFTLNNYFKSSQPQLDYLNINKKRREDRESRNSRNSDF